MAPKRRRPSRRLLLLGVVVLAACAADPLAGSGTTTSTSATPLSLPLLDPQVIVVQLAIDRRVDDEATANFAEIVQSVLADERGWVRAGYRFRFGEASEFNGSPNPAAVEARIVLAEGDEVDQLCLPYDTYGQFSCQIGPVVALNADRWRFAVDSWPASLDAYRTMLVNHEVGHLLGQHHPALYQEGLRCPAPGEPTPVMAQQSSGVGSCLANPWPLQWEIDCALERLEPLAPPFERGIGLTCGPDGPLS